MWNWRGRPDEDFAEEIRAHISHEAKRLAGAAAMTKYLEGMLFAVAPLDSTTFLAVSLLFFVVASVAALMPAQRATKINPLTALRYE